MLIWVASCCTNILAEHGIRALRSTRDPRCTPRIAFPCRETTANSVGWERKDAAIFRCAYTLADLPEAAVVLSTSIFNRTYPNDLVRYHDAARSAHKAPRGRFFYAGAHARFFRRSLTSSGMYLFTLNVHRQVQASRRLSHQCQAARSRLVFGCPWQTKKNSKSCDQILTLKFLCQPLLSALIKNWSNNENLAGSASDIARVKFVLTTHTVND